MPKLTKAIHQSKIRTLAALDQEYEQQKDFFIDVAKFVLPRKYIWLQNMPVTGDVRRSLQNENIYDGTGTRAVRKLSAGMIGGLTSPTRPWFRLHLEGIRQGQQEPVRIRRYLDTVQHVIQFVLSRSNFYSTMASEYIDLGTFGTGSYIVYEDDEDFVRFYLSPVGEFRIAQDSRRVINTFSQKVSDDCGPDRRAVWAGEYDSAASKSPRTWSRAPAGTLHNQPFD